MKKPTVISLFAGCGGSSLGYQMAGFRELLAVEWDDNAVETFKLNFKGVSVYHGDIGDLSVDECLRLANVKPGELDILDGSPPCQGFSTAGKRDFGDDRNQLFKEYVRLLKGLKPKVFVMENVSGMVKGKMKLIFAEILRMLKAVGYKVSVRLLNAMYYGVPQSRQRLIFVGVREDLGIEPSHPKPQTKPICFRDAVFGCDESSEVRDLSSCIEKYVSKHPGGWSVRPRLYKSIMSTLAGSFSLKFAEWGKVLQTISKSEIATTGILHPDRKRYISLSEAKRCSSFPDMFLFTGRAKGIERIGNSVPPLMMKAIALHIKKEILNRIDKQP